MIVENTTILSGKEAQNMMIRSSKTIDLYKIILIILIIGCGIYLLISGIIAQDTGYTSLGGFFVAIALVYILSIVISNKKLPKKIYDKNTEICDLGIKYIYKFKEQSVMLKGETVNKSFKVEYKYDEIKKILEYEDGYELKLSTDQILFVKKDGFSSPRMIEYFVKNLTLNKKKIKSKIKK